MDENGLPLPGSGCGPGDTGPERLSTEAKTPHERLAEVLPRLRYSTAQFGLFRRRALALTRGIDSFYASDRVLLAEVAMLGKIAEVDAPLFARRQHAGISTTVHKHPGDYARWFNPGAKGWDAKRRRIMSLEYARSVYRLPLSPRERGLCLAVVVQVWARQKLNNLLKRARKC
jgi:hypothetical protein